MNRLFWGLLFCLLDYDVTVGTAVFGLLPDFLGYFLMMKGMEELAGENRFFDRGRHMAFGLMIAGVILYGADLMNPGGMTRVIFWAAELAVLVIRLVLLRVIIAGILRMEQDRGLQLRGDLLKSMWTILIVICPLAGLVSWLPLVGDICRMASAVVSVLFLAVFRDSRKEFCQAGK